MSPGAVAFRVPPGLANRLRSVAVSCVAALVVFESMRRGVKFGETVAAAIILVALVILCSRRPHLAVVGIVAWVPLQLPILAYLFKIGAPASAVRYLGYLKEFWAIALLVAVVAGPERYRSHRRFDALDWLALSFIALSLAYLLLPFIAPGSLGGQTFQVRLNAWRAEALFVVVFFLARQLVYPEVWLRRVRTTLFVVASVLAGFAVWERLGLAGYRHFVSVTLDYSGFSAAVLKTSNTAAGLFGLSPLGNSAVLRVGSLLNDPLILGFFMLIPFGLGLERLAARRLSGLAAVATAGSIAAIVLTLTRSALLGAGVAAIHAVGFASRRSPGRLRLVIAIATAAVILIPAAGHSSIKQRFEGIFNGAQTDDSQAHISASRSAFNHILSSPTGAGLGSNTGTSLRFNTGLTITAEDSYLETGAELGLAAMVLLVGCVLLLLIQLRARSKLGGTRGQLAAGAWMGGCGLALGACFLQTWLEIPTALVFWVIAGMALAGVSGDGSAVEPIATEVRANALTRLPR
ncbi:MAG: O-antigen ligase family protein [Mycobacteriales bacterium]